MENNLIRRKIEQSSLAKYRPFHGNRTTFHVKYYKGAKKKYKKEERKNRTMEHCKSSHWKWS